MRKLGYCSTCNRSFPVEVRIAGKVLAAGASALLGSNANINPWVKLAIGIGSIWLGHQIDKELTAVCPTPGCKTILELVDAALT